MANLVVNGLIGLCCVLLLLLLMCNNQTKSNNNERGAGGRARVVQASQSVPPPSPPSQTFQEEEAEETTEAPMITADDEASIVQGTSGWMYDPHIKVLTCAPFKSASSTMRRFMSAAAGLKWNGFDGWMKIGKKFPRTSHLTHDEKKEMLKDPSIKKIFAFREPFERLLSGYLHWCVYSLKTLHSVAKFKGHCHQRDTSVLKPPTFPDFVKRLHADQKKRGWGKIDIHFRPFSHQPCGDIRRMIPYIHQILNVSCHEPNLEQQLLHALGSDDAKVVKAVATGFHVEKAYYQHASGKTENYRTPELEGLVRDMYERDYELWELLEEKVWSG
eukprot:m.103059 g.103059  ORF g.103059 m.103059 type:complete len:330 (+) comp22380_c0_seq4:59-1048(+)